MVMKMNLYDIEVLDSHNQKIKLSKYQGHVLLIVNTATECEFTEQYDHLEDLYEKYHEQGFTILDFPCNQFGEIDVNGPQESPVYTYLKEHQKPELSKRIEWNFTKFLLDQNGHVVERFEPLVTPYEIEDEIIKLL